jgi:hypothetical protein
MLARASRLAEYISVSWWRLSFSQRRDIEEILDLHAISSYQVEAAIRRIGSHALFRLDKYWQTRIDHRLLLTWQELRWTILQTYNANKSKLKPAQLEILHGLLICTDLRDHLHDRIEKIVQETTVERLVMEEVQDWSALNLFYEMVVVSAVY